jgi:hypothetical protein
MENSLKGLLLAAGIAITCMVISLAYYASGEAKNIASNSNAKLTEFSKELNESDLTTYDGLEVTGSDVVNFIKKKLDGISSSEIAEQYIYVKTSKSENTFNNVSDISNINNFTHLQYINPLGKFVGEIVRDSNEVIRGIRFIQK